jgi:hypothetical protein
MNEKSNKNNTHNGYQDMVHEFLGTQLVLVSLPGEVGVLMNLNLRPLLFLWLCVYLSCVEVVVRAYDFR